MANAVGVDLVDASMGLESGRRRILENDLLLGAVLMLKLSSFCRSPRKNDFDGDHPGQRARRALIASWKMSIKDLTYCAGVYRLATNSADFVVSRLAKS